MYIFQISTSYNFYKLIFKDNMSQSCALANVPNQYGIMVELKKRTSTYIYFNEDKEKYMF